MDFARGVYQDFCHLVESHWDDIAPYARGHSYWGQQGTDNDDGIRKRRTVLATLLTTAPTVVNTWPNELIWSGVITRLKALFDFLEASGCFILRRGTIENYYLAPGSPQNTEKPSRASEEAAWLRDQDTEDINQNYGDIIRALQYASRAERIDETRGVRELLLAIAAPVLDGLSPQTTDIELQATANRILQDRAMLFTVTNCSSEVGGPAIRITLRSSVLSVPGFPLVLRKGCNVNQEVETAVCSAYEVPLSLSCSLMS